jgi:methylmalonyl-CoA/ethylmalonyl-CoA epimerase
MASVQPSHIAQIAIPVRDLQRAKSFYGERLGLTHLFDAPPGLAFFQCGETRLMLSDTEAPAEDGGGAVLFYAVPSARAAQQALAATGLAFEEDAHCIATLGDKEIWLAASRDSEGNRIALMSEEAIG